MYKRFLICSIGACLYTGILFAQNNYLLTGKMKYVIPEPNCQQGASCCYINEISWQGVDSILVDWQNFNYSITGDTISDLPGDFQFATPQGQVGIKPTIYDNGNWLNGVDIMDAFIVRRHVQQDSLIVCPFSRIAGDVDNNGALDGDDFNLKKM